MNDLWITLTILGGLGVFTYLIILLKKYMERKYGEEAYEDKIEEIFQAVEIAAKTVQYVLSLADIPHKDLIAKVTQYVMEAMELIDDIGEATEDDMEAYFDLVVQRTKDICEAEGITVDDELINLISITAEFVLNQLQGE